jgi:hypothetical protein
MSIATAQGLLVLERAPQPGPESTLSSSRSTGGGAPLIYPSAPSHLPLADLALVVAPLPGSRPLDLDVLASIPDSAPVGVISHLHPGESTAVRTRLRARKHHEKSKSRAWTGACERAAASEGADGGGVREAAAGAQGCRSWVASRVFVTFKSAEDANTDRAEFGAVVRIQPSQRARRQGARKRRGKCFDMSFNCCCRKRPRQWVPCPLSGAPRSRKRPCADPCARSACDQRTECGLRWIWAEEFTPAESMIGRYT